MELGNGGQGRTDSRSESGQRSCPKGEDRPRPIRVNRTIDTRIFSTAESPVRREKVEETRGLFAGPTEPPCPTKPGPNRSGAGPKWAGDGPMRVMELGPSRPSGDRTAVGFAQPLRGQGLWKPGEPDGLLTTLCRHRMAYTSWLTSTRYPRRFVTQGAPSGACGVGRVAK